MRCTAPVRGHRSPRAWARCPACRGGGGWAPPGSSFARPEESGSLGEPASPRGLPRQSASPATSLSGRSSQEVRRALIEAGLDAAASQEFTAALIDVAVALQSEATSRKKASHWLCELLAEAADAVDPGSVASAVGHVFADFLVLNGAPDWAATIAGWGIAQASRAAISSLVPASQLCLGLRVLALLVCPSPPACPVGAKLSVPILKASLTYW